jgi:hypothetical protein
VVRKFKSKQLNGNQVKHLNISLDTLSNQLYRRLPVVFPNLTRIRNTRGSEGQRDEYTLEPMTQWATKLEEYDMSYGQLQLDRLMLKHSFIRITSLVVSPEVDILACLPNVPLLKDLAIFNFELDIEYLESMHALSANVTRFKLQSGLVRMQANKRLPHDIQPLVNLTSLTISSDVAIADKECFFLDYICTKYTKLLDFSFLSTFKNALLSRHRTLRYTRGGNNIIYFNPLYAKIKNIYTEDNVTHGEFESTRENYLKEGGTRFLSKLSNTIATFQLEVSLFENLYTALDQSDLSPVELHLHDCYEPQQRRDDKAQFQYTSKLRTLKKLVTSISDMEDPFGRDVKLRSLESLTMTIRRKPHINSRDKSQIKELDFGRLLYCFPSLKELALEGQLVKLTTNDHFTSRAKHRNLLKLEIRRCITLPLINTFLYHSGEAIQHLEWPVTSLIKTRGPDKGAPIKTYELKLPNNYLKTLKLTRIPYLRLTNSNTPFTLYVEINAGLTTGKYTVESRADGRITSVRDTTYQAIDLTGDVIDLTELPEENENLTKLIVTLKELDHVSMDGYNKDIPLHRSLPRPTIIDD